MYFLLFGKIILIILEIIFLYYFLLSFFKGVPYAPTKKIGVRNILFLAKVQSGEKMIDLGSGDGRIVIAFAKKGVRSYGLEINKILIFISRLYINFLGLRKVATILNKNFWQENYSSYNIITIFGQPLIMKKLERKIFQEVKPGTRIIVNRFAFVNKKYIKKENNIYLYIK